jgi:hypothetical protein
MEAICPSETMVTTYETTHFYPEDGGSRIIRRMVTTIILQTSTLKMEVIRSYETLAIAKETMRRRNP